MADAAFQALPQIFRDHCRDLVIRVEDWPDQEVLDQMGIQDPLELTGLYQGIALTERMHIDLPGPPDAVWLYRRPILDEWCDRGDVALDRLVGHVLVHEIAHHFGMTDDQIAAIDPWWE